MALKMALKKIIVVGLQLVLAVVSITCAAPSLFAQQLKWEKLAPFPEPAEEILDQLAKESAESESEGDTE